jgi:phosphate transport system protein
MDKQSAAPIRKTFEHRLAELNDDLLRMGSFVTQMLTLAVRSLVERDEETARRVLQMDEEADAMDLLIETKIVDLLATQQPLARDLRYLSSALKIVTDLERVGDHSCDCARVAVKCAQASSSPMLVDLPKFAGLVIDLLQQSLRSFVDRDVEKARGIGSSDDAVDAMYRENYSTIVGYARAHPEQSEQAARYTLLNWFLERIADHAVNVAERVVYMETGEMQQIVDHSRKLPRTP